METQMIGQTRNTLRRAVTALGLVMAALVCVANLPATSAQDSTDRELQLPREFQPRTLRRSVPGEIGKQLATAIGSLYNPNLTTEERLAAGEQVRGMLSDPAVAAMRASLNRRVDLITAGLQAGQLESLSDGDRDALESIVVAANRFEDTCSAEDAEAARDAWVQLLANEDVAAILRPVFMQHYFNHNMHVTLSEHTLSKFVSDYRTDNGTIAECILGAWVTGSQVTNASVSADIRRSTGQGHFMLRTNGQVTSNTQGRRKPATIFTRGTHTFRMDAPVYFDGETLTTGQASIDVNTNNQTVGVRTDYDGIPLLGPLARSIARKKARQKRGQSELIAARKIANRALPEFVEEANERFAEANASIQDDLFKGLNAKGVGPDSISSRSSSTHLAVSSRTMGSARLGGGAQPFGPLPPRGLALQVHESAINNIIDGLELGGRAIPEDDFRSEISKSLSDLLQKDIQLGSDEEEADTATEEGEQEPPATFIFSEVDPVRVRIEENTVVLILKVTVVEDGKDPLPQHRLEIPIGVGVDGANILLTPPEKLTAIRATALEPVQAVRRAGIANQIRRIVLARLPERRVDGTVSVKASDTRNIDLQTVELSAADGWLYVEMK